MRNIKIVADSSANVLTLETMAFAAAPLKIITNEKEFADDAALDVAGMVQWFDGYKGKSKTSCPNPSDWLESLKNFAANGRVSPAVAKIAGVLGIRIVGKASDLGTLELTNKCRGEAKTIATLLNNLKDSGLRRGKVRIAHCQNETAARGLQDRIQTEFPEVDVAIHTCRGLCSYYAEKGGLLVGFEKM